MGRESVMTKIKHELDHHPSLHWIDTLARKVGFVKFLHLIRDKQNKEEHEANAEAFRKFYELHAKDFDKLSEMLEDDFSRYTLKKVIEFRKTFDRSVLKDVNVQPQYFQKDIFGPVKDEVFVDGGAYVGDTVESFIKNFAGGGGYKKIYSWEPDEANLKTLKEKTRSVSNIEYIPCGMWNEKTQLYFEASSTTGARVVSSAGQNIIKIDTDSIDNVCSMDKVTLIKMDIEGSEMAALKGAINVIKRDKPRLAICIYHKFEDLYEIPFWVKETIPEYKLYIRHHSDSELETVLYATI